MAEFERDERVSGAYQGLGREQPPPELDAAILAASRRRGSRWAVPVSVAAVVILAVGVTLRVQMEERKEAERIALSPQVMQAPEPAAAPARPEAKREARVMEAPAGGAPQVSGVRGLEASGPVGSDSASVERRIAGDAAATAKIAAAPETPEQWLERIVKLRDAGKVREADESLAEFRRRYPDYRIPEAMRARVAPR